MPTHTVLLLGRLPLVVDEVSAALDPSLDVHVLTGTSVEDVITAFAGSQIDTVIMGAGIDLETRLRIVRHVFETSDSTSVHMKDRASGPGGMTPFVNGVLTGTATG